MPWNTFWEIIIDIMLPVNLQSTKPCAMVKPTIVRTNSGTLAFASEEPSNDAAPSRNIVANAVPATIDNAILIVVRRCLRHNTITVPDEERELDLDLGMSFKIAIPCRDFNTVQTTQDNKVYARRIINHYIAKEQLHSSGSEIILGLKKKLKFRISLYKMRKRLTKMGYLWHDTKTNPTKNIIVESPVLRLQRQNYIQILELYRAEGRPIIYLSKYFDYASQRGRDRYNTFTLNACSGSGTLPQLIDMYEIEYSKQLEEEQFQICKDWIRNKVIPKIPQNAVIVLVNLPFQNRIVNPPRGPEADKQEMRSWLLINETPIKMNMFKPQLCNLINQNKEKIMKYSIDRLFKGSTGNFTVVHCPPQHYDLDMTHLFWCDVLYELKLNPRSIRLRLRRAIRKHLTEMSVNKIYYMQRQIMDNEKDYMSCDFELDTLTDHYRLNCNLHNREKKLKRFIGVDTRKYYVSAATLEH